MAPSSAPPPEDTEAPDASGVEPVAARSRSLLPQQTADDFVGNERFLVQRRLGAGAYGVVYEAYDRREEAIVAVKVLRFGEADALYRFKKGFRSLAEIRHPNLAALYELGLVDGLWLLTMERVDGVDVVDFLRGRGAEERAPGAGPTVAPWVLVDVLRQLALGLAALHGHGKLHRDVKPSNVLVTAAGRVVLLDFGLLGEIEELATAESGEPALVGTPAYMAPEQAEGAACSPASDWYAMGIVVHEAIYGRLPFTGSLLEVVERKLQGAVRPAEAPPGVPAELVDLCFALLAPRPDSRPRGDEILGRLTRLGEELGDTSTGRPGGPSASSPSPAAGGEGAGFVGRRAALGTLDAACAESRRGALAVYVSGESGIGKSALLARFAARLRARQPEAVLLEGRCYPQESVPYKAFDPLIDALSRHLMRLPRSAVDALLPADLAPLVRLFPVLLRVTAIADADRRVQPGGRPQELRRRAVAALRELLAGLAAECAVVLVVDDLQWGDADSARLVGELLAPPAAPPILFVGCYRSEDAAASPFVRAATEVAAAPGGAGAGESGRRSEHLLLERLSTAEVRRLTRLAGSDATLPAERLEALVMEADGSPFVALELLRGGALGGVAAADLATVLRRRVGELPAAERRMLEVVAVAGRPLDVPTARRAAALEPGSDAVAALVAARLLRRLPGSGGGDVGEVEVYHDRIREAVLAAAEAATLRHHHRRLAESLEARGDADPGLLAVHFRATKETARAARYAATAAERAAAALAFDRAIRLYRMALELESDGAARHRLRVGLGATLAHAGRNREAAEAYLAAVVESPREESLAVQRAAAESLLVSGHVDRGLSVLGHVLRRVGLRLEPRPGRLIVRHWLRRLRLRLRGFRFRPRAAAELPPADLERIDVCWSVVVGLGLVDVLWAADFHARHLLLALAAGEPRRVARGLAMEVFFGAMEGGGDDALEAARQLGRQVNDAYAASLTETATGMLACSRGRWEEAHGVLARADEALREMRVPVVWEVDTVLWFRLLALAQLGRWPQLFAELPDQLRSARERGDLFLEIHLLARVDALRRLAAGQAERSSALAAAAARWSQRGFQLQRFEVLVAEVQRQLFAGDAEGAWVELEESWPALAGSMIQRIEMVLVESHDLRARVAVALAAGRGGDAEPPDEGEAAVRREVWLGRSTRDRRVLERVGSPWAQALATALAAGAASVAGRYEEAARHLDEAALSFRGLRMEVHALVAARRQAELRGDAGRVAAADRILADRGVEDPVRLARLYLPGRWRRSGD